MAALSTYLANRIQNNVLRGAVMTGPAAVYLALYTAPLGADDSSTEVSGGSYARAVVTFAVASGGISISNIAVSIIGMPAVTVTHIGLRDALTGGNLLYYSILPTPKTINAGDTYTVQSGDFSVAGV